MGFTGAYAAAQAVAVALSRDQRGQYRRFDQPPFAPPGAVVPVVWTALNATTATSAWRVWDTGDLGDPAVRRTLAIWGAAVVIRSGYTPLAFGQRRLWWATADAALLAATMTAYTISASRVDPVAAILALPETAWTSFATVLSTELARRN
jgi:tryptophan-rich sensory protein